MKRLLLTLLLGAVFSLSASAQYAMACIPEEDYQNGDYESNPTVYLTANQLAYEGESYYDWDEGKEYRVLVVKFDPFYLNEEEGDEHWYDSFCKGYDYDFSWYWIGVTITYRIKEDFGYYCSYLGYDADCFEGMFDGTYAKIEGIENLSMGSTPISLKQTFRNCEVENVKLRNIEVSSLEETFQNCISLKKVDLSEFHINSGTSLKGTFSGCRNLTTVITPSTPSYYWNLSNVTDMSYMFSGCEKLTSIDVSKWDMHNVTDISYMFRDCKTLENIDTSKWNLRNLQKAQYAFYSCYRLQHLIFGQNFKLSQITNATNLSHMFGNLCNIRYIDFFASDDVDAINSDNFEELFSSSLRFTTLPSNIQSSVTGVHTVIYLPHGSNAITDKTNVIYSNNNDQTDLRCPRFDCEWYEYGISDIYVGYTSARFVGLEYPRAFTTNAAYYNKINKDEYGSAILPYEFVSNADAQAFTLHHENPQKMYLEYRDRVPAHQPFIYHRKNKGSNMLYLNAIDEDENFGITINQTHTTAAREGGSPYIVTASDNTTIDPDFDIWSAKGFYERDTLWNTQYTIGDVYYIKGNKFVKANGEHLVIHRNTALFYGYWTQGIDATSEAKEYSFDFAGLEGEGTGIDGLSVSEAAESARTREDDENIVAIYDATGKRRKKVERGLNILKMKDGTTRKLMKE